MNRLKSKDFIIFNNNANFSNILSQFNDTTNINLSDISFLYIGYSKPILNIYIDIATKNNNDNIIVIEKYNGFTWEVIDRLDGTNGFKKSGHIELETFEDEKEYTHNGIKGFYTRISLMSGITNGLSIRYINNVFCNEDDLFIKDTNIKKLYPVDSSNLDIETHITSLIEATRIVLKKLAQVKMYKYNGIELDRLNQHDIIYIDHVRDAAKYYALANIYDTVADTNEYYKAQANMYKNEAEAAINSLKNGGILTIDSNNNGKIDDIEIRQSTIRSFRLGR